MSLSGDHDIPVPARKIHGYCFMSLFWERFLIRFLATVFDYLVSARIFFVGLNKRFQNRFSTAFFSYSLR
jgi:hypothetical protein